MGVMFVGSFSSFSSSESVAAAEAAVNADASISSITQQRSSSPGPSSPRLRKH